MCRMLRDLERPYTTAVSGERVTTPEPAANTSLPGAGGRWLCALSNVNLDSLHTRRRVTMVEDIQDGST